LEAKRIERFIEHMLPAVSRAAARARTLEGHVRNAPKFDEASPEKQALTEADLETQEIVLEALFQAFPDVTLAAEEDTPSVSRFPTEASACVVVDPIDGTLRSYLEGCGPYSLIVGLAVEGVYRAGIVALPREGLIFDATSGGGAFVTRPARARRAVRASFDSRRVLLSNGAADAAEEVLAACDYEVIRASGGAVAIAPAIDGLGAGVRHSRGAGGISVRGRVGVLIAREAGALVEGMDQAPFPTDMAEPAAGLIVAADAQQLDDLREALSVAVG